MEHAIREFESAKLLCYFTSLFRNAFPNFPHSGSQSHSTIEGDKKSEEKIWEKGKTERKTDKNRKKNISGGRKKKIREEKKNKADGHEARVLFMDCSPDDSYDRYELSIFFS